MGTIGFAFIEYATPQRALLEQQFQQMGFHVAGSHRHKSVTHYIQGEINFLINTEPKSHAQRFAEKHGASACGMGFRVEDASYAYDRALKLGAKIFSNPDLPFPAIEGIGGAPLYFVDNQHGTDNPLWLPVDDGRTQRPTPTSMKNRGVGLGHIDHLTHNVNRGRMDYWADFYTDLFNFSQIRYFNIEGQKTGLISRAMGSPCGKIKIPLNESKDDQSQIEEFIQQFHGEGIQHIALTTENIFESVESLREHGIRFMDVPDTYYEMIEERLPKHGEDLARLHKNFILIDGDTRQQPKKTLLQIFTHPMLGPVFFEIIQRKGDEGFGEGNFQALFESIERDQIRRGVI